MLRAPVLHEPATGDYEVDRQRHVRARRARLGAEAALLTTPLAEVWRLRDERLRRLLRHARARSPWHARRLAGIDLDAISGADLSAIPPMTKADLLAHWDEIVTDPRLDLAAANAHLARVAAGGEHSYLLDDYHVVASGGSTGVRAVVAWDFDGFLHHHLAYARVGLWRSRQEERAAAHGEPCEPNQSNEPGEPSEPGTPRQPTAVAAIYAVNPVHISAALGRCFATDRYPTHLLSATTPLPELVAALNALQPTNLATYPSLLHLLARRAAAGALRLRLRRITTNGEPLLPEIRAAAEAAFGVTPENGWGTSETAPLACSDGVHDGLVLVEDKSVIEPVDDAGRPVPPGVRAAKVLATNVVNRLLPLIRYEVTDEVTFVDGPNPGPWTGRLIEQVHGRLDDAFAYGDEVTVHPFTFRAILGEEPRVSEYQVLQTPAGAEVRFCAAAGSGDGDLASLSDRLARNLEGALRGAGLPAPRVALRRVDRLERHRETGKLRRFVPLADAAR